MKVVSGQWLVARKTASSRACRGVGGRRSHSLSTRHPPLARRGITLLEVLISIFILSIGLLGVASLIPAGKLMLIETNKSDRTGACGRAALRQIKIQRMLDPTYWSTNPPGTNVFVIDPLGISKTLTGDVGPLKRINLTNVATPEDIFRWQDDLTFDTPSSATARPRGFVRDTNDVIAPYPQTASEAAATPLTGTPSPWNMIDGNFSWFLTASPATSSTGVYNVSIVVCHKRNLSTAGETSATVTNVTGGYGGVSISISGDWPGSSKWKLKNNDWILLCSYTGTTIYQASWYRVVGVGYDGTDTQITLAGPDWNGGGATITATSIEGVSGVYSTTVQLDSGIWAQ